MIEQLPSLDENAVKQIKWTGDPLEYDNKLFELGRGYPEFIVFNPWVDCSSIGYVHTIPKLNKCLVWNFQGNWIAKKFNANWNPSKGYESIEIQPPKYSWFRNLDIPKELSFEGDIYKNFEPSPWDSRYEHIWYMDPRVNPLPEKVWVFSCQPVGIKSQGTKDMGNVLPKIDIEINKEITNVKFNLDECYPPYWELDKVNAWDLDLGKQSAKQICLVKFTAPSSDPNKWNWLGSITPVLPDVLDVIFISYGEPNAEENWIRVLEKAPYAKRVDRVDGIFEAHKAAAKLSKTDMFYVVDGDAWLVDEWQFDYQPEVFDRDCSYVWNSRNPINDLVYENGGVKLFPRALLMKQRKWKTLDMFTTISDKIKVTDTVSNVTTFNTSEFSTWRSAFRECVKLYNVNQITKLNTWLTKGGDRTYGEYAILGAEAGYRYAKDNRDDHSSLVNINDYSWLEKQFKETNV